MNSRVRPSVIATGIRAPHREPLEISRGLMPVPEVLKTTQAENPLDLRVIGPHEIATKDYSKSYILSGIAVRCINACFILHEQTGDRDAWTEYAMLSKIGTYPEGTVHDTLSSSALSRTVRALEEVRYDIDGITRPGIIETLGSGSGTHILYRIAADLSFHDERPPYTKL